MPSGRRSRKRPWADPPPELDLDRARGGRSSEQRGGLEWIVQQVRSGAKSYRCPGCQQEIALGTAHVVAWTEQALLGPRAGVADRRHWHAACWRRGR
ncbi:MAG: hypothetical protein ACTMIR_09440 [Cellulomonadaceae bacterium]